MKNNITRKLIASCGMNCGICMAFLREKNHCSGCGGTDSYTEKIWSKCKIKNCNKLKKGDFKFCFACEDYPCAKIKHLDKRYRTRYGMSMIENLDKIKRVAINEFVKLEKKRWRCASCGDTICVHRGECSDCHAKTNSK